MRVFSCGRQKSLFSSVRPLSPQRENFFVASGQSAKRRKEKKKRGGGKRGGNIRKASLIRGRERRIRVINHPAAAGLFSDFKGGREWGIFWGGGANFRLCKCQDMQVCWSHEGLEPFRFLLATIVTALCHLDIFRLQKPACPMPQCFPPLCSILLSPG